MDVNKEIRAIFKEIDVGRQYLKRFKNHEINTKSQLKSLTLEKLKNVIGEDDLDGSTEIIWKWITEENKKEKFNKTSTESKVKEKEKKEEIVLPKIDIKEKCTFDPKRSRYLKNLALKLKKSKLFKYKMKTIGGTKYGNLVSGKQIIKILTSEEDFSETKSMSLAEELMNGGLMIGVGTDIFENEITSYYKFYFSDNFGGMEETFVEDDEMKIDKNSISHRYQNIETNFNEIKKNVIINTKQMEKLIQSSETITKMAKENCLANSSLNIDESIFLKEKDYIQMNYLSLVADNPLPKIKKQKNKIIQTALRTEDVLSVKNSNTTNKIEENFYELHQNQMKELKEIGQNATKINKEIDEIESVGIKIDRPKLSEFHQTVLEEIKSFKNFEEERKKKINLSKNRSHGNLSIKIKIKDMKIVNSKIKDNLFIVFKLNKFVRRTDCGKYSDKSGAVVFHKSSIALESRKTLSTEFPLKMLVKSYDSETYLSKVIVETKIDLKDLTKPSKKNKNGVKSFKIGEKGENMFNLRMKTKFAQKND